MLKNHRHERFAQGIAQGLPATDAYIKAGYKARGKSAGNAASRLLENVGIQKRLAEIAAELESRAIATAEEIQKFLTSVMRGEVTEQLLTRDGDLVTAQANVRDRTKAAELLGRAQGVFALASLDAAGELDAIARALQQADNRQPPVLN